MSVVIETTVGHITVDLYLEDRPRTCMNFLKLCKVKYYNLCSFHKIERNFIAQTGDPTGNGRGGESIFYQLYGEQAKYFEAELKPRIKHKKLGTLSMVNNGADMNGSQFFLTLGEDLTYLDELHTVFGEVAEGLEVLLKLNDIICDSDNRPYQDIRITHTVILHDPYEDPKDLEVPISSPVPTKEMIESMYFGSDEDIDETTGKSIEEIEEEIKDKEAKSRATILEMVGDIPDADVKPPETVLFVCKLNPVTTSEDLEIIFSRFGSIKSCEVIKDRKTGESLQYAFIEFEREGDCENAFFKMDNVLIDDRRIHVDFSQSVSKMKWGKGTSDENQVRKRNYVLKDDVRKKDNYEMIFDTDESDANKDNINKKHKQKYKNLLKSSRSSSPYSKHAKSSHHKSKQEHYTKTSSYHHKSKHRRSRTPSPYSSSHKKHKSKKEYSKKSSRKSRTPSPYSSSCRKHKSNKKYSKKTSRESR